MCIDRRCAAVSGVRDVVVEGWSVMCLCLRSQVRCLCSCMVEVWYRGTECGSVLLLSDVGWSWQIVVRRISGVFLCLVRVCLLMQCGVCVLYVTLRQSCVRCLGMCVGCGVVGGRGGG